MLFRDNVHNNVSLRYNAALNSCTPPHTRHCSPPTILASDNIPINTPGLQFRLSNKSANASTTKFCCQLKNFGTDYFAINQFPIHPINVHPFPLINPFKPVCPRETENWNGYASSLWTIPVFLSPSKFITKLIKYIAPNPRWRTSGNAIRRLEQKWTARYDRDSLSRVHVALYVGVHAPEYTTEISGLSMKLQLQFTSWATFAVSYTRKFQYIAHHCLVVKRK